MTRARGEILWLEAASVADIADNRDVVAVAKQCVCRLKQKRVPTIPFRMRIGRHPSHSTNGRFAIVDIQHHWKAFVLLQHGVDFAVATYGKHHSQRGLIWHFAPAKRRPTSKDPGLSIPGRRSRI